MTFSQRAVEELFVSHLVVAVHGILILVIITRLLVAVQKAESGSFLPTALVRGYKLRHAQLAPPPARCATTPVEAFAHLSHDLGSQAKEELTSGGNQLKVSSLTSFNSCLSSWNAAVFLKDSTFSSSPSPSETLSTIAYRSE